MEDEQLRSTPFYRSLHRPAMVFGCERELTLISMLIAGVLIFSLMSIMGAICGAGLWFISLFFLRRMAKADPCMSKVYRRQIAYAKYYPAKSTPWRNSGSKRIY